jgi:hypothetical protein
LVCPSETAPATDRTVVLTVNKIVGQLDADHETAAGGRSGGSAEVMVTCLIRSDVAGDTAWLADTADKIDRTIGTLRNQVVNGIPVAHVTWQYTANLGQGDRGRPEWSVNYRTRCALPVLA